jgi:putative ATPase
MRPRSLDEFVGQDHIVGPGRLLRRAIQRDRLSSIILSGPPGTGKTTLARVIANTTSSRFLSINAVLSGVQAIRDAIESARREHDLYDRRTILFVDEVHRWNKAQQDALLPWVENGTIILIGATTENPFFEVNRALVSRSRIFQLQAMSDTDLARVAAMALADTERGYGSWQVRFADGALEHLLRTADGDARTLLNALELAIETSAEPWPPASGSDIVVSMGAAEESIQKRAILYDKDGDCHYDAASAFIKSIRGSDPDAALYWLARMVYAGEEPRFIFRRMLISACEDIGLADPQAVAIVTACATAYERIGLPEGQFHLSQAALYLSTAPKSNSTLAYFDALKSVEDERAEVPDHLKDGSRDAEGLGHGAGYLYPHAYRGHWTAQQYLPDAIKGAVFYRPGAIGYEASIRETVFRRREAQLAAWLAAENRTTAAVAPGMSPGVAMGSGTRQAAWTNRPATAAVLSGLRDALMAAARVKRHENVLVLNADDGLLILEVARACPDGSTWGLLRDARSAERLAFLFRDTEELSRPALAACPDSRLAAQVIADAAGHEHFELVIGIGFLSSAMRRGPAQSAGVLEASTGPVRETATVASHTAGKVQEKVPDALAGLRALVARLPHARFVLAERIPAGRGLLPDLANSVADPKLPDRAALMERFAAADEEYWASGDAGLDSQALMAVVRGAADAELTCDDQSGHCVVVASSDYQAFGARLLTERDLQNWFDETSAYGQRIRTAIGTVDTAQVLATLRLAIGPAGLPWPQAWAIISACPDARGSV